jgi:hypothetical protein
MLNKIDLVIFFPCLTPFGHVVGVNISEIDSHDGGDSRDGGLLYAIVCYNTLSKKLNRNIGPV